MYRIHQQQLDRNAAESRREYATSIDAELVIDLALKTYAIGEAVDAINNSSQVLPLTAAQTGMWFAHKFSSSDSIFNLAESIEIHGPIDPALFEAALRQAGMEAETVRVRFIERRDGPRQMISSTLDATFPFIDVSAEP